MDHEEIVSALEKRDPVAADEATKKHIRAAYASRIKKMFSSPAVDG
jgi:DNA-binding GntR family transcriptional regulator